jgi:hypothetical protein
MSHILPQQELLLELLTMSGDIAMADNIEGTILYRTLIECERKGWVVQKHFGAGFNKLTVTDSGRNIVKGRLGK